jgi:hypothetical protein
MSKLDEHKKKTKSVL